MSTARALLLGAGGTSAIAAVVHLAAIIGGPSWYRFFGAGEPIARAAERGSIAPALMTVAIATVLAVWAAYAFSAAGAIRRLPLLRTALVLISAVLLARGLAILVPQQWRPDLTMAFKIWSSLIVLAMAMAFALGSWLAWPSLAPGRGS